jgi:chromatin remodeling complex protein RSC6
MAIHKGILILIQLNRLQDSENSKLILNNKELQGIFGVDKMDITSIPSKLYDHLKFPDPIEISYTLE